MNLSLFFRIFASVLGVGILAVTGRFIYRTGKTRRRYQRDIQTWRDHIRQKYGNQ